MLGIDNAFNIIVIIAIISGLISIPLSYVTGKHFDNLLDSQKIPKPIGVGIMPTAIMNRAVLYVGYIMWNGPKKRRWNTYRDQIGDFNFRAHARPIDYVLIISETVTALCALSIVAIGVFK